MPATQQQPCPAPLPVRPPIQLGPYTLANPVFVAPMAGVTDRPFRQLCRQLGAGYAVSEMAASDPRLWDSVKTSRRLNHEGEDAPIAVQLVGADAHMLAQAARYNVSRGAQIIDINMGCPAKKVCGAACGSALLKDEAKVRALIEVVVEAVSSLGDIPVTLKFRTGWDLAHRNALRIAHIAQDVGVRMLVLHGRTRSCGFKGQAEYDTIAAVKQAVRIPVVANGDIDTPQKARDVFAATGADAIMIGRAALGRPWLFREINHYLHTGTHCPPPTIEEARALLAQHLDAHHRFYGSAVGVRTARKHLCGYLKAVPGSNTFGQLLMQIDDCAAQARAVDDFFKALSQHAGPYLYPESERLLEQSQ